MLANLKSLPLKIQKGIEQASSWSGLSTPYDLLLYFARNTFIDPTAIVSLKEVVTSSIEPAGEDRDKLWIKTEGAPALGIPIGGTYQMIYQYPPNVPFIWTQGIDVMPSYISRLETSELGDYGLTNPTDVKFYYAIFKP